MWDSKNHDPFPIWGPQYRLTSIMILRPRLTFLKEPYLDNLSLKTGIFFQHEYLRTSAQVNPHFLEWKGLPLKLTNLQ